MQPNAVLHSSSQLAWTTSSTGPRTTPKIRLLALNAAANRVPTTEFELECSAA
jgi:hypothetical protein